MNLYRLLLLETLIDDISQTDQENQKRLSTEKFINFSLELIHF